MKIYTEMTPNPASLKFVVDRILLANQVADYPDAAAAKGQSQLAEKLFSYPFVTGVFIGRNFVTVSKQESATWADAIPVIKDELTRFFESGLPLVENMEVAPVVDSDEPELIRNIKQVIDEQVRPAVAMDGGDIVYQGFEDGIVRLQLRGSCSGCPSSTMTLKQGIQGLLTRMFPEVKEVEAING
jgi:Fe-S cluster biogenesis protein NfuA